MLQAATASDAGTEAAEAGQAAANGSTPSEKPEEGAPRETPAGAVAHGNGALPASLRRSDLRAPGASRLLSGGLSGAFRGPKRLGTTPIWCSEAHLLQTISDRHAAFYMCKQMNVYTVLASSMMFELTFFDIPQ